MPAKSPAAIRQQIASGHPDPIYLVQGDDDSEKSALAGEFADLVDEGLRAFNVERIHAGDMTTGDKLAAGIASLIAAARTLPMMSPWRVILVMQAEALVALAGRARQPRARSPSSRLPSAAGGSDRAGAGRRTDRQAPADVQGADEACDRGRCGLSEDVADAERWVRARVASSGVAIEPAAARMLVARAGFPDRARPDGKTGSLQRVRGDVDRLLLYALGQKIITVDDVKQIAGPAALQDDWAMTRAIEQRNAADALRQLALTLEAGAPPEKVLGSLAGSCAPSFRRVPREIWWRPSRRCFERTWT